MGLTLKGPFKEVVSGSELEYRYNSIAWVIFWDPNKAINVGEWPICGGGRVERFYYIEVCSQLRVVVEAGLCTLRAACL